MALKTEPEVLASRIFGWVQRQAKSQGLTHYYVLFKGLPPNTQRQIKDVRESLDEMETEIDDRGRNLSRRISEERGYLLEANLNMEFYEIMANAISALWMHVKRPDKVPYEMVELFWGYIAKDDALVKLSLEQLREQ
ncbi:MAG: hypothetical protein WEC84_04100 [Candidatus Andersenbacteria bacterium]